MATKKSMRLGGGGRFEKLEKGLEKKFGKKRASAIAASAGRKKYGRKRMAKMAARGRKRSGRKRGRKR